MNIKIVNNPSMATGLVIVIDVFRAFTVEPYLINNNAKKIIPVGEINVAYEYKNKYSNCILIGERNGIMLTGFDYGNSPSQIKNVDFTDKTIIHTTSCGTQGIVKSTNATEILTGSLVNSKAIAKYIIKNNIEEISLLTLSRPNEKPFEEDILCAQYIKSLLEKNPIHDLKEKIEQLKNTSGAKFFNKENQKDFPEEDFYLCTDVDKFNFILKVNKNNLGEFFIERIDV